MGSTSFESDLLIGELPGRNANRNSVGAMLCNGATPSIPVAVASTSYTESTVTTASLAAYKWKGVAVTNGAFNNAWALVSSAKLGVCLLQISNCTAVGSIVFSHASGAGNLVVRFGTATLSIIVFEWPTIFRQSRIGQVYGPFFVSGISTRVMNIDRTIVASALAGKKCVFHTGPLAGEVIDIEDNSATEITLVSSRHDTILNTMTNSITKTFISVIDPEQMGEDLQGFHVPRKSNVTRQGNNRGKTNASFGGMADLEGSVSFWKGERRFFHATEGAEAKDASGNTYAIPVAPEFWDPTLTTPVWFVEGAGLAKSTMKNFTGGLAACAIAQGATAGYLRITSSTHGLRNGQKVFMDFTANFTDGLYEVFNITASTFDVKFPFATTSATVTWWSEDFDGWPFSVLPVIDTPVFYFQTKTYTNGLDEYIQDDYLGVKLSREDNENYTEADALLVESYKMHGAPKYSYSKKVIS